MSWFLRGEEGFMLLCPGFDDSRNGLPKTLPLDSSQRASVIHCCLTKQPTKKWPGPLCPHGLPIRQLAAIPTGLPWRLLLLAPQSLETC